MRLKPNEQTPMNQVEGVTVFLLAQMLSAYRCVELPGGQVPPAASSALRGGGTGLHEAAALPPRRCSLLATGCLACEGRLHGVFRSLAYLCPSSTRRLTPHRRSNHASHSSAVASRKQLGHGRTSTVGRSTPKAQAIGQPTPALVPPSATLAPLSTWESLN